jgi:hypothetical protein
LPAASGNGDDVKTVPGSTAASLPDDASKAAPSSAAKPIAPDAAKQMTADAAGKSPIPKPGVPAGSGDAATIDPALAKAKAASPDVPAGTMSDGTGSADAAAKEKSKVDKPAPSAPSKLPEPANVGATADSNTASTPGIETAAGKSGVPGLERSGDVVSDAADTPKPPPSAAEPMEALDATAENASSLKDSLLSKLKDAVG